MQFILTTLTSKTLSSLNSSTAAIASGCKETPGQNPSTCHRRHCSFPEKRKRFVTMASHSPNLECRVYEAKYPEVDMAVMIQVMNIADMGAYVSLLEYNNIEGMTLFILNLNQYKLI
ncbi:hypothetical protein CRG98_015756 [Punica granatum]|uniref:S1 motif domain-containing protein n=2 Tax=Punica granatum TaxID=22663 RepID=A0A2I0K6Y1_PUNGR|nr:hypothetical protein CRG98_015756 [Punica granatum]